MIFLEHAIRFFLSLRTTLWFLGILLIMLFAGAIIMPGKQEFQGLHTIPLFTWLNKHPFNIAWWLWCLIGILTVLTVNTLFCSIESVFKKKKATHWLLFISPQIIHIGFLFMLLAHLFSALGSSQRFVAAREGSLFKISENNAVQVKGISVLVSPRGYISGWEVSIEYLTNGKVFKRDKIKPNQPSIQKDLNINVKNLRLFPKKTVLLQINREPGAVWALTGGVLFMAGIFILIILKIKKER